MRTIKTFRITPDNEKLLKINSKQLELSEGWIINQALQIYMAQIKKLNPMNYPR